MRAHNIVLWVCVLALLLVAHGCKGTPTGADFFQEMATNAWSFLMGAVAILSGEWLWSAALAALGFLGIRSFQDRQPFEQHITVPGRGLDLPPPRTPPITEDPLAWLDRLWEVLWAGLWFVIVALAIAAVLWHYRRRIWTWITSKKGRKSQPGGASGNG